MVRRPIPWLLLASLLVAGCSGGEPAAPPSETTDPVVADGGIIRGTVLDEEGLPVPNVAIVILELERETKTDETGSFSFDNVPPGTYRVLTDRFGYDVAARQVQVVAGGEHEVSFSLTAIVVAAERVISSIPFEGLIQCSVNPVYAISPCGGITGPDTSRFTTQLDLALPWKQSILEGVWTPTTDATSQELELDICDDNGGDRTQLCAEHTWYAYESGGSPLKTGTHDLFTGDGITITPETVIEIGMGAAIGSPFPVFQQPIQMWLTHCYNAECPESFSAIPPE